jgi:hypothetical protein
MMFFMWDEKVERFSVMLCPSPTSQSTRPYILKLLLPSAGTCRPLWAIRDKSPTVLSATVLPPVLGPVTTTPLVTSPFVPLPSSKSSGTAAARSISGWRAPVTRMCFSV